MLCNEKLVGQLVTLRDIEFVDCTDNYLKWMTNQDINQFMETRWIEQTPKKIYEFVENMRKSDDSILFAIIENISERHIGNIKLGPINKLYNYADISYFIGEKNCWNKGYAAEAIKLVCNYAFDIMKLHRVQAGVISGNDASVRVLQKVGFSIEGRRIDKFIVNEEYVDHIILGMINK